MEHIYIHEIYPFHEPVADSMIWCLLSMICGLPSIIWRGFPHSGGWSAAQIWDLEGLQPYRKYSNDGLSITLQGLMCLYQTVIYLKLTTCVEARVEAHVEARGSQPTCQETVQATAPLQLKP